MAKKSRTQVDYNPGQASLQGGVGASAGNYRVAVAPTPKTNAALQFASVINQLPNAAGQLTNYANKVATDRVSQMSDDEILEELSAGDKETFSILKYNKTFNYELVKRKYLMEQQNIANEYDTLASDLGNNPDSADIDTAIANMESDLFAKFSKGMTNDLQMQAHKALWNATTAPLKAQAFSKYKALKEEATKMVIESNAMEETFYSGDITDGFRIIKNGLDDLGVPKKEQTQRLMKATNAYFDRLMFNGRFDEAEAMIGQAEAFEFYSGAKLGGIAEYKSNFIDMSLRVRNAKQALNEEDEVSKTEKRRAHVGKVNAAASSILDNQPLTDVEKQGIIDAFQSLNPSLTSEELEEILTNIEDNKGIKIDKFTELYQKIGRGMVSGGRSDYTRLLFEDTQKEIDDYLRDLKTESPYKFNLTNELSEELVKGAFLYFSDNPEKSVRDYLVLKGVQDLAPGLIPKEIYEFKQEATKGFWVLSTPYYRNLNTYIGDRIRNLQKKFDDDGNDLLQANISKFENRLKNNIDRQIKNKAFEISGSDQKEEIIEEFANDLIQKEIEIFEAVKDAPQTFESLFKAQPTFENEDEGVLEDYDTNNDGRIDSKERTKVPRAKRGFLSLGVGDYEEGTISERIENVITENKDNIRKYPFFGALTLSDKQFNKLRDKKDKDSFYRLLQDTDTKQDILNKIQNDPDYLINVYNQLEDQKDTEALSVSLYYFGYPKFTPKSAKHLAAAKVGIGDIKLFRDTDELDNKQRDWESALQSQNNLAANPKEKRATITNLIKEAASFGIDSIEDLKEFVEIQEAVIKRF
tara:strand:+ start:561 stop:2987 length:2427 start_codon:yes stop_codon:yes gene_type:complete